MKILSPQDAPLLEYIIFAEELMLLKEIKPHALPAKSYLLLLPLVNSSNITVRVDIVSEAHGRIRGDDMTWILRMQLGVQTRSFLSPSKFEHDGE
jgi:hypothetical protein